MYVMQVYTVGPDYAHAEARKSPALDGKVERNKDGKEIRYPVLLSAKEKLIARTVCLAFKVLDIYWCFLIRYSVTMPLSVYAVPQWENIDATSDKIHSVKICWKPG